MGDVIKFPRANPEREAALAARAEILRRFAASAEFVRSEIARAQGITPEEVHRPRRNRRNA